MKELTYEEKKALSTMITMFEPLVDNWDVINGNLYIDRQTLYYLKEKLELWEFF